MIIYRNDEIEIQVSQQAGPATLNLLKNVVYGTEGIRYQHTGQEEKVKDILNPFFFELRAASEVVGTYCLSQRPVIFNGESVNGIYGRYLAIEPAQMGKGYGNLLKQEAVKYVTHRLATEQGEAKSVFFSFIEEKNLKSLQLSRKADFFLLGELSALVFSRIYPKKKLAIERWTAASSEEIKTLLTQNYARHQLFHPHYLGYRGNYFIFRDATGQIAAGVQANPTRWKVKGIAGVTGKLIMRVLPRLPILRRLFNPANYTFLALEGLYVQAGREKELAAFLESVLAEMKATSAVLMLDSRSPLLPVLQKEAGLLEKINKKVATQVWIKSLGAGPVDQQALLYASSFDFT